MNSDSEGLDRHDTLLDILVTLFHPSVHCPLPAYASQVIYLYLMPRWSQPRGFGPSLL